MLIRLGLPKAGGALMRHARKLCAPLLLSAGCFGQPVKPAVRHAMGAIGYTALASGRLSWPQQEFLGRWLRLTHTLGRPDTGIWEMRDEDEGWPDIALDSAGFVAWSRHGGYPWPLGQYVELALDLPWTWWAAPDACCEPEIAEDAVEVDFRIRWTASALSSTLGAVDQRRAEQEEAMAYFRALGWPGQPDGLVRDPMPVLQGWTPEDYIKSAVWTEHVLRAHGRLLPDVLGVGSVCRRKLNSGKSADKDQERRETAGLLRVLDVLHAQLPRETRLHLFGVKSDALPELERHFGSRVLSVDSQAWDAEARRGRRGRELRQRAALRRDDPVVDCPAGGQSAAWADGPVSVAGGGAPQAGARGVRVQHPPGGGGCPLRDAAGDGWRGAARVRAEPHSGCPARRGDAQPGDRGGAGAGERRGARRGGGVRAGRVAMSAPWITPVQGALLRAWVEAALRGAGFEVCSFYGSGSDPQAGWVRCWWAGRACELHLAPRRPYDPGRAEDFRSRLNSVMQRCGLVQAAGGKGWTLGAFNRALDLEWKLQQATRRAWAWSPADWGYRSGGLVLCDSEHGGYQLELAGSVLMPWVMPRDGEGLAGEDQADFHTRLAGRVAAAIRRAGAP